MANSSVVAETTMVINFVFAHFSVLPGTVITSFCWPRQKRLFVPGTWYEVHATLYLVRVQVPYQVPGMHAVHRTSWRRLGPYTIPGTSIRNTIMFKGSCHLEILPSCHLAIKTDPFDSVVSTIYQFCYDLCNRPRLTKWNSWWFVIAE